MGARDSTLILITVICYGCGREQGSEYDPPAATPKAVSGRVIDVIDAETVDVQAGTESIRVRLAGVDAPDADQPCFAEAKQWLTETTVGKDVFVVGDARDRSGRLIADIIDASDLAPSLRETVNVQMVRVGFARHDRRLSNDEDLARAELAARQAGRGLWSKEGAGTPPKRR